jgi:hypothetical protein
MARGQESGRHPGRQVHFGAWVDRLNSTVARNQMGDYGDDDPADSSGRTMIQDVRMPGGSRSGPVRTRMMDPRLQREMDDDDMRGMMEGGTSAAY